MADNVWHRLERHMIDIEKSSFEQLADHIYPEVVTDADSLRYSDQTIYYMAADLVRVAFLIDIRYSDGTQTGRPVIAADLARWGIDREFLVDRASRNRVTIPVSEWDRIGRCGRAYYCPDFTKSWTSLLFLPIGFDALNLKGAALMMIAEPEFVAVTGSRDVWGIRAMLNWCLSINEKPITTRPLLLDKDKWVLFDDSSNLARRTLLRRLGPSIRNT